MSLQVLRKGLLRLPSLAARPARNASTTKTNPAVDPVGAKETIIGLSAFFLVSLIPAGYFFVNLENYKKQQ